MKKNYPSRAANVPVTQKMLYAVRDELNSSISALDAKVDSRFHQLTAQIHQMKILVEEQNSKNNIVLDGLTNLFERHTRLDHSFREDGLISDDLKIGQPRYSGASPTGEPILRGTSRGRPKAPPDLILVRMRRQVGQFFKTSGRRCGCFGR